MQTCSAFPWEASIAAPFPLFCLCECALPIPSLSPSCAGALRVHCLREVSKQIPNNPAEFPFLKNFPLDFSYFLGNIHDGIEIADI
jgi:hypothetical protein